MELGVRLLAVVGWPSLFAGAVVGLAWTVYEGPGGLWKWLLVLVFVGVGIAVGSRWWLLMVDAGTETVGPAVSAVAALALVICAMAGIDRWLLHERGRETTCSIRSVNVGHDEAADYYTYRLACDGGRPSSLVQNREIAHAVGRRVRVRYDPDGSAITTLATSRWASDDGRGLLLGAGAALALLVVTGLGAVLTPR